MRTAMDRLLTLVAQHHSTLPPELINAALELGMAINRHTLLTAPAATLPFTPRNGVAAPANRKRRILTQAEAFAEAASQLSTTAQ